MNILIPDSWLREYLQTNATPAQIKEYLSLCGPSVERIHKNGEEIIYDIEITTNRPDAMSVSGIAREAAAILPRFGIPAKFIDDPYGVNTKPFIATYKKEGAKKLSIKTDAELNPRWASIVITDVKVRPSPQWLQDKLVATGIRSLNNVVDITNYLMRAFGQPAHVFDYDAIAGKNGIPTMELRASRKGEKMTTLDGKSHTLPGNDIVITDAEGDIIDLCGIMGGKNSSVKETTTTVILFIQTYNPTNIRKTSMNLAHRTEAAGLFEKGVDTELVLPTLIKGVELMRDLTGGTVASKLYDLYPTPYKPYTVSAKKEKITQYIGTEVKDKEISSILTSLGFTTTIDGSIKVLVPSFRRDVILDVDIIEEIARMYGYQNIGTTLPETAPPMVIPDPILSWESEIKTRLRDWGFTETYSYSMISEEQMNLFGIHKKQTYTIANPLSSEWVYMRPTLLPSMLASIEQNLHTQSELKLFELSMAYIWQDHDLPHETSSLVIALTGETFREAKGLAESIFLLLGIPFPKDAKPAEDNSYEPGKSLQLGVYGSVGMLKQQLQNTLHIKQPVTIVQLNIELMTRDAQRKQTYVPIAKYPPVVEDISFVVPVGFQVGPLLDTLKKAHARVSDVAFLDAYENKRTLRVHYSDPTKTLNNFDIAPIRQRLIEIAEEDFEIKPV